MAEASAGFCGFCVESALFSWCIVHPFGADVRLGCCGGSRGCCGSCCDSSFNEDDFDERMKKEQVKEGANAEAVDSQPIPSHGMSTITDEPKPTEAVG